MYYQVTDFYDPVGGKKISSKCPDCGNSNCLELSFYQKRTESPFSKKIFKKVTGILFCHHTQTEIAPVLWTDEIENYFNTEKTKLKLQPSKLKFTKGFYLIIAVLLSIIGIIAGYMVKDYITSNTIKNISIGDKVLAMYSGIETNNSQNYGNTWFLVKQIEADTIWLQRHKDHTNDEDFSFDLNTSNFNREVLKASLPQFKERTLIGFNYSEQPFTGLIIEAETNSK